MNTAYQDLLTRKRVSFEARGLARVPPLNPAMFPHQAHGVEFGLRQGCSALFYDTGLGKSLAALEWGRVIVEYTNRPVLMLAPLAVGHQHEREAAKFGIAAKYIRDRSEITGPGIWITNYDRLGKFDLSMFVGIILDESGILKSFGGATSQALIESFARTPYRLACTATPAPNDFMELGRHSAFLGVMSDMEMLSRWFINDTSTASQKWRLKGHAVESYWDWVASWARCVSKPSDLGFSDDGFALPELRLNKHVVEADWSAMAGQEKDGQARLFRLPETSATSIYKEKRLSLAARMEAVARLVNDEPDEPWIVWVETDAEADAIGKLLPNAVEVRGSMTPETKERRIVAFGDGEIKQLISKVSICGYGLNWQHCRRVAFPSINYSWEGFYQAVRRCWRFGQTMPVHAHVIISETEADVWASLCRKQDSHDEMTAAMRESMKRVCQCAEVKVPYNPTRRVEVPQWVIAA
jgi:hypothetical protein